MTTYQVTAWCTVPHYTTYDVDAGSIDEALEKARSQAKDEYGEPCDGAECDWDEFEIASKGDGDEYMRHLEPSRSAKNAAPELLDQLERGVIYAQSILDSWGQGDLAAAVRAMAEWLADARTTVDQATKRDASEIR